MAIAAYFHGTCCGRTAVATAVECRSIRLWLPWIVAAIGVEVAMGYARGSCRGTSVECHDWDYGGCHGQNRSTCHGHNSDTCRRSAMHNKTPLPLPWKLADFHGSQWQDPRKTTEAPRSLPRTSAQKSNDVHPWARCYRGSNLIYDVYMIISNTNVLWCNSSYSSGTHDRHKNDTDSSMAHQFICCVHRLKRSCTSPHSFGPQPGTLGAASGADDAVCVCHRQV